ncbi:MAG: hypothetical protein QOE90_2701 [Thermoplasmata archaeon]|nr:hypothetical protein [Thermoplasmata archaeon]
MTDNRPFYALAAVIALVALALLVPASRAFLAQHVGEPLRGQADPGSGARVGYDLVSLAFWALVGAAFAWAAYELLFRRLGMRPDARFFAALAPFLLFGPLLHALLAVGILSGPWAYPAAEPLVYLTTAALALGALLAARAAGRWQAAPMLGLVLLVPLLAVAGAHTARGNALRVAVILALALVPALALGYAYARLRRDVPFAGAALVVGAHALDGATTWMVLRDPFGLGFRTFGEKNPVSETLVQIGDGWPYFAVKLALPLVLLWLVRPEEKERDLHAFLLLAVFILGWGPGMANLLQVMLG